jgi:hypothetical protein
MWARPAAPSWAALIKDADRLAERARQIAQEGLPEGAPGTRYAVALEEVAEALEEVAGTLLNLAGQARRQGDAA